MTAASGSEDVMPDSTTIYTLRASGPGGNCSDTVTVTVDPPCEVNSFSATPSTIDKGGTSSLSWTTSDATRASIDQGVGSVTAASGSEDVKPASTTTYTLTGSGPGGNCSDSVTVTVRQPMASIEAASTTITQGESTTLSWSTKNVTRASINPGIGVTVTPNTAGSTSVSPATKTTYTLTAINSADVTLEPSVTINVTPKRCVVGSFSATPSTITAGGKSSLSWTTNDATSASIDQGVGSVTPVSGGSVSVSPTATTTYTLTASGSGGNCSDSVTVTVTQPVPTANLEANPTEFFGLTDPVDLTWSTSHATSASIDNGVGSVTPVAVGTVTVYPEITTTYTLTASGPGGTAYASVEVFNVDNQRVLTASLTADSTTITQGGSTTLSWTTEGADSASIDQGVGSVTPVSGGSVSVSPTATTTYTLTATSGEGDDAVSVTDSVTVTVTAP